MEEEVDAVANPTSLTLIRTSKFYSRQCKLNTVRRRKLPELIPISAENIVKTPGSLDGVRDYLRKIIGGFGSSTLLDSLAPVEEHTVIPNFSDPCFGSL